MVHCAGAEGLDGPCATDVYAQWPRPGTKFEICHRYTSLKPVGEGACGIVCAARDEEADESIAIKKIENAFGHLAYTKRILRELRFLRHLRHENLVEVRNVFLPGPRDDFEDIYIVSELMETDLASILGTSQPLTDEHCSFFLYQILRGMKFVHSANVIHRDLKPRNLLVNSDCDLKICDFGLSRVDFPDKEFRVCPLTEYVCTRWYRAPEVLLPRWKDYTTAIDVWAIGCIFAEMVARRVLFPGRSTQHQLRLINDFAEETPQRWKLCKTLEDKRGKFVESLPPAAAKEILWDITDQHLDLLTQTLQFRPDTRMTVAQALQHPYLAQLHCPEDEPTRGPLATSDFEFERRKLTVQALREELFLEALNYCPEKRRMYIEDQEKSEGSRNISSFPLLVLGESQFSAE